MRIFFLCLLIFFLNFAFALPSGFVYLHEISPEIRQDIRYAKFHNFVGRPIRGYNAPLCILTTEAAIALAEAEKKLAKANLGLKVYDCYRPVEAVQDFIKWSQDKKSQAMKKEFYPSEDKANLFKAGYVALKSGHSRGSTVDISIVQLSAPPPSEYQLGQPLTACNAGFRKRFYDNSIDMGSGFDCFDDISHTFTKKIHGEAIQYRKILRETMMEFGFEPYEKEWWHFTLKKEPFPNTYFHFVIPFNNHIPQT